MVENSWSREQQAVTAGIPDEFEDSVVGVVLVDPVDPFARFQPRFAQGLNISHCPLLCGGNPVGDPDQGGATAAEFEQAAGQLVCSVEVVQRNGGAAGVEAALIEEDQRIFLRHQLPHQFPALFLQSRVENHALALFADRPDRLHLLLRTEPRVAAEPERIPQPGDRPFQFREELRPAVPGGGKDHADLLLPALRVVRCDFGCQQCPPFLDPADAVI